MALVIALIYFVGLIGSVVVGRFRAGLSQRGRLSAGLMLSSLPWTGHQIASMFFWPVFLVVWLVRGRPASPWQIELSPRGTMRVARVR